MSLPVKTNLEIIQGDTFSVTFTRYSEDYLNYRGAWSSLIQYEADDVVIYKNTVYKCILDTTLSQLPTNVTYFGALTAYDYSTPAHTVTAKIRTDYNEEASIVDFTTTWISGSGSDGKIKISLTATQTAALDFKKAVFDVEVTNGTDTWKETYGNVTLKKEVTK